jgi:hypothetical protein
MLVWVDASWKAKKDKTSFMSDGRPLVVSVQRHCLTFTAALWLMLVSLADYLQTLSVARLYQESDNKMIVDWKG